MIVGIPNLDSSDYPLLFTDESYATIGKRKIEGASLMPMRESSHLIKKGDDGEQFGANTDWVGMRARLDEDGFIFLRNIISAATIDGAHSATLSVLKKTGAIRPGSDLKDGFIANGENKDGFRTGREDDLQRQCY